LAEDERVAIERRAGNRRVIDLPPEFGNGLHPVEGSDAGIEAGVQGAVRRQARAGKDQGEAEAEGQEQRRPEPGRPPLVGA